MIRFVRALVSYLLLGACTHLFALESPTDGTRRFQIGHSALVESETESRLPSLIWSTDWEFGVVGFDVVSRTASGEEIRHNVELIPAVNSAAGSRYVCSLNPELGAVGNPSTNLALRVWGEDGRSVLAQLDLQDVDRVKPPIPQTASVAVPRWVGRPPGVAPASSGASSAAPALSPVLGFDAITGPDGVYGFSVSELAAALARSPADLQAALRGHTLGLASEGRPLPWTLAPGKGGGLVYLPEKRTLHLRGNVFQSSSVASPDLPHRSVAPVLTRIDDVGWVETSIETDVLAVTTLPGGVDDDFWVWDNLLGSHSVFGNRTYPIVLPGVVNSVPAELTIELATTSEAAHRFQVLFNGRQVGATNWNGRRLETWTVPLKAQDMRSGTNQIVLISSGDRTSLAYLDRFHIRHGRQLVVDRGTLVFQPVSSGACLVKSVEGSPVTVWDVTDPGAPVILGTTTESLPGGNTNRPGTLFAAELGHRYAAFRPAAVASVSRWASVTGQRLRTDDSGVDYLVVSPDVLLEPARRLAEWRQTQGLRARVVTLGQIRHEFSHGFPQPGALRDALIWARAHWGTAPRYVVLLGDGTYDYRAVQGGADNLVPPPLVLTAFGRAAADPLVLDEPSAPTSVGRLSVRTAPDLHAMIDRLMAYEARSAPATPPLALLLADQPDPGGAFLDESEVLARVVAGPFDLVRAYNSGVGSLVVREQLRTGLSRGATWWNYVGHGGRDRMGVDYVTVGEVAGLDFGSVAPLVTAMTCVVGQFALPGQDCLAEAMVRKTGVAPIAVWSPSGFSVSFQAAELNRLFAEELTAARRADRLGDLIRRTRQRYLRGGGDPVTPEFYNLLGDPALRLSFPVPAQPTVLSLKRNLIDADGLELWLRGDAGSEYQIEVQDPAQPLAWVHWQNVRLPVNGDHRLPGLVSATTSGRLYRAIRD